MNNFHITVPATSANIGPGFDSAGLALSRYLILHVEQSATWKFDHQSAYLPPAPDYSEHLIYRTAKHVAALYKKRVPSCNIRIESTIPLARGLGSSASAIVAGVELANQLASLQLSNDQKLHYAAELEGHPDNVAPALFGGMVFSAVAEAGKVDCIRTEGVELDFVTCTPDVEMDTETARRLIPDYFSKNDATRASATSNVMIGALLSGDYTLAGEMMERDVFHEPYRQASIPNYDRIKREAKKLGAYSTVISGAGPTMIAFVPKGLGNRVKAALQRIFPDDEVACLQMDREGLRAEEGRTL